MRKKIMVAAVASALAVPALVFAQTSDKTPGAFHVAGATGQSSVTLEGTLLISMENQQISNAAPGARAKSSETRLQDESSDIRLLAREDLGNGLAAVGRFNLKPTLNAGAISLNGESWVGLDSKSWGSLTAGRHALHYFKTPEDAYYLGGSYRISPSAIVEFVGGGRVAIANGTRTPNTLKWTSPKWNGFDTVVGYSFSPTGTNAISGDLTAGNTVRDGRAWNVNPTYTAKNWAVGYSYWDSKTDAPSAIFNSAVAGIGNVPTPAPSTVLPSALGQLFSADQRSNEIYGHVMWGGWKLGLMWNKSQLKAAATAAGLAPIGDKISDRTAFSIPLRYATGPHTFMATYTKGGDDSVTAAQDGAKLWALTYAYSFSKRTHVALQWASLKNDAAGAYTPYAGASGGTNAGLANGESARMVILGMRHNF